MSHRLKMRHVLAVSCIGLILTFQNCSQSNFDGANEAQSFAEGLPFAYQAKIDTIAYMSCSNMLDNLPDKRGYFTIRAGAYGACNPADTACQQNPFASAIAGMSMSSDFREATKYYEKKQRAHLFSLSGKNSNTMLSLSVRKWGDLQSYFQEGNLAAGEELDAMLPALDTAVVAGPLAFSAEGQQINYFPGAQAQRLMEGSLRQYNYENIAKQLRNNLNSKDNLLVMSYSDNADVLETALRIPPQPDSGPQFPKDRAYGTGFFMDFALPTGPSGVRMSSGEARVVSGIQEMNLITSTPVESASWNCSTNYQFMVVRPQDAVAARNAGQVLCNFIPDEYRNAAELEILTAIRRVMRTEDWFVDIANRCVMPKRTGDFCYGSVGTRAIQYRDTSCVNATGQGGTTLCPHYVSVCVRR